MAEEKSRDEATRRLTHELFTHYPDYALSRTLAENIANQVTTHPEAIAILARKAEAARQNRERIQQTLDRRSIHLENRRILLKDLSLTQITRLQDRELKEVLDFYFKHPYAHGRTKTSRLLPRWLRSFFLSALLGHARRRNIQLDYASYFDLLRLL